MSKLQLKGISKKPSAAHRCMVTTTGIQYPTAISMPGIRVFISTGRSNAKNISIPIETEFTHETFLKLKALPDKAPEDPIDEDAEL